MDVTVAVVLLLAVCVVLLVAGRRQIAAGANAQVANRAVLLTLAAVGGVHVVAMVASLGIW